MFLLCCFCVVFLQHLRTNTRKLYHASEVIVLPIVFSELYYNEMKDSLCQDSRMFREFMKNKLFLITVRTIAHLETLDEGLTPAAVWGEVRDLISELRSVEKQYRAVLVNQFYINYYNTLKVADVDRTVTMIFYCLALTLEAASANPAANPHNELIDAIVEEMIIIGHPILDTLNQGVHAEELRYESLHRQQAYEYVDPLDNTDSSWDSTLKRILAHYAKRVDSQVEPGHQDAFYRFWDCLAADVQLSELMRQPAQIKGDEHAELKTPYNAKLLFNIYGMLYSHGFFKPSIKGETPLSKLVTEHYDLNTHMKTCARYEYFKCESVGARAQFIAADVHVKKRVSDIIKSLF